MVVSSFSYFGLDKNEICPGTASSSVATLWIVRAASPVISAGMPCPARIRRNSPTVAGIGPPKYADFGAILVGRRIAAYGPRPAKRRNRFASWRRRRAMIDIAERNVMIAKVNSSP